MDFLLVFGFGVFVWIVENHFISGEEVLLISLFDPSELNWGKPRIWYTSENKK